MIILIRKKNKLISLVSKCWILFTALIFVAITGLSLFPLPELPEVPGKDKTMHFVAYAVLALPASIRNPKHLLILLLCLALYSGLIELIQPYVNRYGEWRDFLANSTGLLGGYFLGTGIRMVLRGDE